MHGHPPSAGPDFEGSNTILYIIYGLALIAVIRSWSRVPPPDASALLDQIPTVYHVPIFSSALNLLVYASNGLSALQRGYREHFPGLFKISTFKHYFVIVTSPRMIEDVRNAPDDMLSLHVATQSMGSSLDLRQQHVVLARGSADFTAAITRIFPLALSSVYDEMGLAMKRRAIILPELQPAWNPLCALDIVIPMAITANVRTILGVSACEGRSDSEFSLVGLCADLARDGFDTSLVRRLLPLNLKSIRSSLRRRRLRMGVLRLIRRRRASMDESSDSEHPTDVLDWTMRTKPTVSEFKLAEELTTVLLATNASITLALTHTLYDLAANPKYASPLRKEIESVYFREGWTKASLERMRRLDSFVKESLRVNAVEPVSMIRKVLQPFTFSNGDTLPQGTLLCVPSLARHLDSSVYDSPDLFDGFRFSKRTSPLDSTSSDVRLHNGHNRHQMSNTSLDFLGWGHGRLACPGRFYSSAILKMCLAQVVLGYDVRFEDGKRPLDVIVGWNRIPDPKAMVLFRKR